MNRIEAIIQAGRTSATTNQGRSQIDSITICTEGYAEPGYTDPVSGIIAFGNWNDVSKYDGNKFVTIDDAPGRVAKLLERLAELEWSDEWTCCDQCGKAVRTKPDSYCWKPSYISTDDGCVCHECIEAEPTDYLESLEGDSRRCVTIDLDLEANGYKLLSDEFENGLYGGQSDDPELIADALREQGVERFIFRLDATRQFDLSFSVFVHESEFDLIDVEEFGLAQVAGSDPVVNLSAALADATRQMDQLEGPIKIASCDLSTGTATVRTVTQQKFIEGRALIV